MIDQGLHGQDMVWVCFRVHAMSKVCAPVPPLAADLDWMLHHSVLLLTCCRLSTSPATLLKSGFFFSSCWIMMHVHPHLCVEWHCFVCGMSEDDDICLSLLLETFAHFVHCCVSARHVHVM